MLYPQCRYLFILTPNIIMQKANLLTGGESNIASPSVSPISKTLSPSPSKDAERSQQGKIWLL